MASQSTNTMMMPTIVPLTMSFHLLHQGRSLHGLLKKMPLLLGLFAMPSKKIARSRFKGSSA